MVIKNLVANHSAEAAVCRSSSNRCIPKNFVIFTGKQLCLESLLNNVAEQLKCLQKFAEKLFYIEHLCWLLLVVQNV